MAKEKLVALENDLMFASVMQHEKACIKLLQAIFPNKEIDRIEYDNDVEAFATELDVQKFIQLNPFEKSIRLDLYFKNSTTVYNIELQRLDNDNLQRRARAYSSLLDANQMEKGSFYDDLIDSYVIFICMFDPFGRNESIYKFYSTCEGLPDLRENNGKFNIYINTKGKTDGLSFDLEEFFKYINGGTSSIGKESNCELVQVLDGYVQEYNENDTWRSGFMKLDMLIHDNRKEGFEQGLSQGKAQGRSEEKQQIVKEMMRDGVTWEKIAQYTSISVEQVKSILQS